MKTLRIYAIFQLRAEHVTKVIIILDFKSKVSSFEIHCIHIYLFLLYLYISTAILVYRGFRNVRKKTLKWAHAGIHLTAFVLTVIALITVFDSHNLAIPPTPNMYSLHSWMGMGAVIVFGLQYVAGFTAYLAPGWRQQLKVAYMPLHIYFGLFGFVLAIASGLMGITEKAIFAMWVFFRQLRRSVWSTSNEMLSLSLFLQFRLFIVFERWRHG